jgi:hypothetical protein
MPVEEAATMAAAEVNLLAVVSSMAAKLHALQHMMLLLCLLGSTLCCNSDSASILYT